MKVKVLFFFVEIMSNLLRSNLFQADLCACFSLKLDVKIMYFQYFVTCFLLCVLSHNIIFGQNIAYHFRNRPHPDLGLEKLPDPANPDSKIKILLLTFFSLIIT